jgi:uroporphyrinogen decarboxylase
MFGEPFLVDESIPQEKRRALEEEMTINPRSVSIFMYPPDIYMDGVDQWGVLFENSLDIGHPLEDWDDYPKYTFPEIDPDLFPVDAVTQCRKEGTTAVFGGAWPITTFERYRTLRGFENALTDPLLFPDRFEELLDRIVDYNIRQIERWGDIGCDIIGFADDWGAEQQTLISPELWRKYYKPVYRRMCDLIHSSGAKTWMHTDGAITAIIPDLVKIGLDILEPVQAECLDIRELAETYRGQLVVSGGLNSRLVAAGDYDTILSHVEESIAVFNGFGGGLIGTATNLLLPSIDVALAMYHAYRRAK